MPNELGKRVVWTMKLVKRRFKEKMLVIVLLDRFFYFIINNKLNTLNYNTILL